MIEKQAYVWRLAKREGKRENVYVCLCVCCLSFMMN